MSDEEPPKVVDSADWLKDQIERLLESDRQGAVPYLERLLDVSGDEPARRYYCHKHLGILHLQHGALDEASDHLDAARELADDPEVSYALGRVAAARRQWWRALLNFLEAFLEIPDESDEHGAEMLRHAALALRQVRLGETALSVLLGALDRVPDDPYVLEALGRFYEQEQRWLDALGVRDALVAALESKSGEQRAMGLSGEEILLDESTVRERMAMLSRRLRQEFQVVEIEVGEGKNHSGEPQPPGGPISRINYPTGLHTLVEALGLHDRNLPLLETAQALWARAFHDRFDVHLTTPTLAGAIHWIVERLHWRVPTPLTELERLYGAHPERTTAAVRLLVSRFEVELFPARSAVRELTAQEVERLSQVQKALLYDVDLELLEPFASLPE